MIAYNLNDLEKIGISGFGRDALMSAEAVSDFLRKYPNPFLFERVLKKIAGRMARQKLPLGEIACPTLGLQIAAARALQDGTLDVGERYRRSLVRRGLEILRIPSVESEMDKLICSVARMGVCKHKCVCEHKQTHALVYDCHTTIEVCSSMRVICTQSL